MSDTQSIYARVERLERLLVMLHPEMRYVIKPETAWGHCGDCRFWSSEKCPRRGGVGRWDVCPEFEYGGDFS